LRCLILRHLLSDSGHDLVQKLVLYQHRYASLGGSLLPGKSIIIRRSFLVRAVRRGSPIGESLALACSSTVFPQPPGCYARAYVRGPPDLAHIV
jgi:hypothetical protein